MMKPSQPITVSRHSSQEERQFALTHLYYQVLERQPYAFERRLLASLEKDFLKDKIGVRRFLKELGHSEVYLKSFYHNSSNLKFLELCFKHFMGRAPKDQEEIHLYTDILLHKGVHGLITAILDSEEYRKVFGCFTVPYPRQERCYESPRAYLETNFLNREHHGQRGWIVPTAYWHQLGLNCEAGVCKHPEADEVLNPPVSEEGELMGEALLKLLKTFDPSQAKQVIASLSPQQRDALRKAIR
ncbi:MAG: phycobilisome rod-core linker polypeptide [Leptolyngbyaceae cyanobacterium bins.59]|nr:phycobilisome rod-core linker polypeptide [Leptolyngbyaceae cyanobacterium bins.59]